MKIRNKEPLPYSEREEIVNTLFQKDSDLDEYLIEFNQHICKQYEVNMSKKEKRTFYRFINGTMKHIEDAADYLLFYKVDSADESDDNTDENDSYINKNDKGYYFSREGLDRCYYRKGREHNVCSVSGLRASDTDSKKYTDVEWMEYESFKSGYQEYNEDDFIDYLEEKNYRDKIHSQLNDEEKMIVKSIICGYRKSDIIRFSGLSESKLKTRLKRIGEKLYPEKHNQLVKMITNTKTCFNCGKAKTIFEFGKDKRNRDGLRSWCRECTNAERRKKNFRNCV